MTSGVRTIPFVKASANGNDFLLIDGALAPSDIAAFTRRICHRHDGVGADGVEWMLPHFTADVEIRLINADGSSAEISGNGTRCVAAYVCAQLGKERISILTGAGTKFCQLTSRRDSEYEFEIEMGEAVVENELVLKIGAREVRGIPVSMGNPHFVTFVPEFAADWQTHAAEIQQSSHFPQGVNVELVVVDGKNDVRACFYERGVGETLSSGTGSCASAVAAIAAGGGASPVKVHAPGGIQTVRTNGNKVSLRGSARLLCRGEFFLS
ncbi:MAG: diaminopimelate epimerase [Candidatus Sulfotelmatobacter sp.]